MRVHVYCVHLRMYAHADADAWGTPFLYAYAPFAKRMQRAEAHLRLYADAHVDAHADACARGAPPFRILHLRCGSSVRNPRVVSDVVRV